MFDFNAFSRHAYRSSFFRHARTASRDCVSKSVFKSERKVIILKLNAKRENHLKHKLFVQLRRRFYFNENSWFNKI